MRFNTHYEQAACRFRLQFQFAVALEFAFFLSGVQQVHGIEKQRSLFDDRLPEGEVEAPLRLLQLPFTLFRNYSPLR